jgi:signal transduction histidine kinase
VLKFSIKGSKLLVIFILTVLVSGSILTYLGITNISNYRELLEKKISEEQRDLTQRFASDFQNKFQSIPLKFSEYLHNDSILDANDLKKTDQIEALINYVLIDSDGSFIVPYFVNSNQTSTKLKPSKTYSKRLRSAENYEFIEKDFKRAENTYLKTLCMAITKSDSAHVYNSVARLYVKMNLLQKALEAYQTILTKFKSTTNLSGFPYAYFSIIKLLKISNSSNHEQLQKLLLLFLNELAEGLIPLNESSKDLLGLILEWQHKSLDTSNNKLFDELIELNKSSLLLINNYKAPIEEILKNSNVNFTTYQKDDFLSIKPTSGNINELMLFFMHKTNSVGFVIGLNTLFTDVLESQQLNNMKFEYEVKLIEKTGDNFLKNTNLITLTEFSPYFEDSMIQVSLKNESIIDETVFKRKITYVIGLFMFLGIMVFGLYLLIQDIKREKKMNKLRTDFVSNVTHELKTPLTAINMFAEALNMRKVNLNSKQKKYTNIIVKESEKLKRIINNILEFSKKEDNKLSYNLDRYSLTDIVKSTLKEMNYFLEINMMDVHLNISNDIYANVEAEGVKQALSNLISNAIKYSSSNKKLNVKLFKKEKKIFLEVEDFGIGIPKEKLGLIFEKFYRLHSNENETVSGTGLGLTVTKAIIEEQHGKLLVESALGKGSKFTIVLNTA